MQTTIYLKTGFKFEGKYLSEDTMFVILLDKVTSKTTYIAKTDIRTREDIE